MPEEPIEKEEFILRRIPNAQFRDGIVVKPTKLGQKHFRLRTNKGETGLSCNRERYMSAAQLLSHPDALSGSAAAKGRVGEIEELGLKVVQKEEQGNPGHCEIESSTRSLEEELVRDDLALLFKFVQFG